MARIGQLALGPTQEIDLSILMLGDPDAGGAREHRRLLLCYVEEVEGEEALVFHCISVNNVN